MLNSYTYDSLVDEALLLYTSLSQPNQSLDIQNKLDNYFDISVKDLLVSDFWCFYCYYYVDNISAGSSG